VIYFKYLKETNICPIKGKLEAEAYHALAFEERYSK